MNLKKIKQDLFKINTYKKSKKNYLNQKRTNSSVYACYSLGLFLKQIYKYLKTKKINSIFLGTIRFNLSSSKKPLIPLASIEEHDYLSFYWVQIANRYIRQFFNVRDSDLVNINDQISTYQNARYLISLVELSLKSNTKENFIFISPSTGNKIVDQLFKRYFKKKYSLKIKIEYFSKVIKPSNDVNFLYRKISFNKAPFIRPFLMKKNDYSKLKSNKIFIHHERIKDTVPENILVKDLSKTNEFINLNFLSFLQIGSKNKIYFIRDLIKHIIDFLAENYFLLITKSLYLESIQYLSNYIYYYCCINTIKELNIEKIIVSYIDLNYENILYKACRNANVISIFYDFSFGYPITKKFFGRPQSDTIRSPNYLVTFGLQRFNQYNYVNKYKYLNDKTITINSISPLVEFARFSVKGKINFKNEIERKYYLSKSLKISIFDNMYGYNLYINELDVSSCIEVLVSSPLRKVVLSHNKREGFLSHYLSNSDLIYIKQKKGNFSNVFFSDFLISIGFQGSSIKAAFAFKKPLIFFTENPIYFEEANFYLKEAENKKVKNLILNLTYNSESLSIALSNEERYKDFYLKIKENSTKLLNIFKVNEDLETASKVIENLI